MRLQRSDAVAGIPAERARLLARQCHTGWANTERIAYLCKMDDTEAGAALDALLDAGYLHRRVHGQPGDGWTEWTTTVRGSALAMASFAKPISRRKAEALLTTVLERTERYNADGARPYLITCVRVFGSYLNQSVDELGDLDLDIAFEPRTAGTDEPEALLDYAHASGRRFSTFLDRLGWARQELLQELRARSTYINIHVGDVDRLAVPARIVFPTGDQLSGNRK